MVILLTAFTHGITKLLAGSYPDKDLPGADTTTFAAPHLQTICFIHLLFFKYVYLTIPPNLIIIWKKMHQICNLKLFKGQYLCLWLGQVPKPAWL